MADTAAKGGELVCGGWMKEILENTSDLDMTNGRQFFSDTFSGKKRSFFQQNITRLGKGAQCSINGDDKRLLMLFFYVLKR